MAIGIMLYHLHWWLLYLPGSNTLLGRLGFYAVSIFFILSGLSMAVVYNAVIDNVRQAIRFEIKRIFRIWPLMWLAILLTIIPSLVDSSGIKNLGSGAYRKAGIVLFCIGASIFAGNTIIKKMTRNVPPDTALSVMVAKIRKNWMVYAGLALLLAVALLALRYPQVDQWRVLLINLTSTFSIFSRNEYIVTGGWSIGNEMLYYALTPMILALYNKRIAFGNMLTVASILIASYYSVYALSDQRPFTDQWVMYIHPLNHLYLYCMGIFIYYNFTSWRINDMLNIVVLAVAALLFIFIPFHGDPFFSRDRLGQTFIQHSFDLDRHLFLPPET